MQPQHGAKLQTITQDCFGPRLHSRASGSDDDTVASVAFGVVEGTVCKSQDLLGANVAAAQGGDAPADGDAALGTFEQHGHPDRSAHAIERCLSLLASDARHEQGELLSANTATEIALADLGPQALTDTPQHLVSGRVAQFVIHPLEVIDVEDQQREGRTRTASLSPFSSPNVIGMLPGSDPALANEYVLVMGHLDHIGMRKGEDGDLINNGAMDNAGGIASMLEAAHAMAASPNRPRRPVLFAAVTGEEKGLMGADYLSRFPVTGNGRVVGVVNLDMPILTYDFTDVIAFGAEHSTLAPIWYSDSFFGKTFAPDAPKAKRP